MTNRFLDWLAREDTLLLDGGLATELEAQGHDLDDPLWSAALLLRDPGAIVDAHRAYLDAGAQCIISASYQASREGLSRLGLSPLEADRLIAGTVDLAHEAIEQFMREHPDTARPLVAASVGPWGAVQHDGSEYNGDYAIDDKGLRAFHAERLPVLDQAGADVLACETIPNATEAKVLAGLLRRMRTPAWISFACSDGEHLNDGTLLAESARRFRDHPTVVAVGVNCTPPQFIDSLIEVLKSAVPDKAIVVYPNSGERYDARDNSWHGTVSPVECAAAAMRWRKAGAMIIGGCCRMGPRHIAAIRKNTSVE
jgi:homocysteine S-methyltransferase